MFGFAGSRSGCLVAGVTVDLLEGCEDERRKTVAWLVPVVLIYPSQGLPSSPVHRLQSSSQKISGHLGKSKSLVSFFHRNFNQLDKSTFQLYQGDGTSGRKETRVHVSSQAVACPHRVSCRNTIPASTCQLSLRSGPS